MSGGLGKEYANSMEASLYRGSWELEIWRVYSKRQGDWLAGRLISGMQKASIYAIWVSNILTRPLDPLGLRRLRFSNAGPSVASIAPRV